VKIYRAAHLVCITLFLTLSAAHCFGQTTLSPNSGINAADSYIIFDLAVTDARSMTIPAATTGLGDP